MPLPNTDQIFQRRYGGGFLMLFGAPFFLVGLGVMVAAFSPNSDIPLLFALAFGGIFASVGALFIFGRNGLLIDKADGSLVKWWGLMVPMRKKQRRAEDVEKIVVTREVRRSKNSSYTVYPVRLEGEKLEAVTVFEPRKAKQARDEAEALAKFLQKPIHDLSEGSLRIREADTLDLSLRQQFRSGKASNEIPEPPARLKSKIRYDAVRLEVDIPPAGFSPKIVAVAAAVIAIEAFFLFGFILPFFSGAEFSGAFNIFLAVFLLMALAPLLFLGAMLARAFLARQTVSATSQEISLTSRFLVSRAQRIPSDQLEELYQAGRPTGKTLSQFAGNTAPIVARSDDQTLSFAGHLPPDERAYILALCRAVLVS